MAGGMEQYSIAKGIGATIHTVFNMMIMPAGVHIHLKRTERTQAFSAIRCPLHQQRPLRVACRL